MKKKSIILIGNGTIAVNCLEHLRAIGQRPKVILYEKKDTGEDIWTKSLLKHARNIGYKSNVNLFPAISINSQVKIEQLREFGPIDIIISIQPRFIFKKPFIFIAKDSVINLHFAPLPKLRGVSPCSWAFIDELSHMGVTLHKIEDEGIDNGPIIAQKLFKITKKDTAWTLFNKCVKHGSRLFQKKLPLIISGNYTTSKQNEAKSTYHPMGEFEFSKLQIPLNISIAEVKKFINSRIFPPFQLPYIVYNKKRFYICSINKTLHKQKENILIKDGFAYVKFFDGILLLTIDDTYK